MSRILIVNPNCNTACTDGIAAAVADSAAGAFSSLSVSLYYSGSSTPVAQVSGGIGTRVILSALSVNVA